jgi:hypothetical protein
MSYSPAAHGDQPPSRRRATPPPNRTPRGVRLVVDGELGPAVRAGLAPLTTSCEAGRTTVEGIVPDVAALLALLGDLGLELVSLETIGTDVGSQPET